MNTKNKKEEKCECKEISCIVGCDKKHTHKVFFCEKCEPEKCEQINTPKPPTQTGWEDRLNKIWKNKFFPYGGDCMDFDLDGCKEFIAEELKSAEEKAKAELNESMIEYIKGIEKDARIEEKVRAEIKNIISKHNARILNEFQKQGKEDMPFIAYDERICLIPAMEIATDETYKLLDNK